MQHFTHLRQSLFPLQLNFMLIMLLLAGVPYTTSYTDEVQPLLQMKSELTDSKSAALKDWQVGSNNSCNWVGVTCKNNHVVGLQLSNMELRGEVPKSICILGHLTWIDMSGNNITKMFSGTCSKLEYVNLSRNMMGGSVPELDGIKHMDLSGNKFESMEAFQKMSLLQTLRLSSNLLKGMVTFQLARNVCVTPGTIPNWLGSMTKLRNLDLSRNHLYGTVPQEVLALPELEVLNFSHNNLTGYISSDIDKAKNLTSLNLAANQLTGGIPENLGQLQRLRDIKLWYNNLTGEIPTSIGQLQNLETLYLAFNNFSGSIPESLAVLPKLKRLVLIGNSFSGHIPSQLGLYSPLEHVRLDGNLLSGPLPANICSHGVLEDLSITSNMLIGAIPQAYVNCTSLQFLELFSNHLNGSIPDGLLSLPSAREIFLGNNDLSGSVPNINSSNLKFLLLGNNHLVGTIKLGNLPSLQVFGANNNLLEGSVPRGPFPSLVGLSLQDNKMTGDIGMFGSNIQYLNLGRNELSGPFPDHLCSLHLRILSLAINKLRGPLPDCIASMESLRILDLSSNNLQGNLPITLPPQMIGATNGDMQNSTLYFVPGISLPFFLREVANIDQDEMMEDPLQFSIETSLSVQILSFYVGLNWKGSYRELGKIYTSATVLDLSCNSFNGSIPSTFGRLSGLMILNLSSNQLSGKIPSLALMTHVEALDLSNNHLEGRLPESLASLGFLQSLSVSNNNLSGQIPTTNSFDTRFDVSSYSGNEGLCGYQLRNCSTAAAPGQEISRSEGWFRKNVSLYGFLAGLLPAYIFSFTWTISGCLGRYY